MIWPRMRQKVERDDIQVNVLEGANYRLGHHLLVGLGDAGATRRLLAALAPAVDDARRWEHGKPALLLNVGISARGLRRVGVPGADVERLGAAFAQGMAARADLLDDRGDEAPDQWDPPGLVDQVAAVIWVQARDLGTLDRLDTVVAHWRAEIERHGLPLVHELRTTMHTEAREHFGFADGFGQPRFGGVPRQAGESGTPAHHEQPVATGELLFGHRDAMGQLGPAGRLPLARNGTLLVWRKLHQDVAGFRTAVEAWGQKAGLDAEAMAARIIGRWQDGTPLVLAPDAPPGLDPAGRSAAARAALDNFRYGDDPLGVRCPVGAHVRRAHPRDSLAFPSMTERHRIVRRGQPYGPLLPDGAPDDGAERGLLFLCLGSSIERQFEFVVRLWCNDGARVRSGDDRDPLLGSSGGSGRFVIPGPTPVVLEGIRSFVTTRGGEYFLLPGLRALHALAAS